MYHAWTCAGLLSDLCRRTEAGSCNIQRPFVRFTRIPPSRPSPLARACCRPWRFGFYDSGIFVLLQLPAASGCCHCTALHHFLCPAHTYTLHFSTSSTCLPLPCVSSVWFTLLPICALPVKTVACSFCRHASGATWVRPAWVPRSLARLDIAHLAPLPASPAAGLVRMSGWWLYTISYHPLASAHPLNLYLMDAYHRGVDTKQRTTCYIHNTATTPSRRRRWLVYRIAHSVYIVAGFGPQHLCAYAHNLALPGTPAFATRGSFLSAPHC